MSSYVKLKGKFHLIFKDSERFIIGLALSYLSEKIKRCRAFIPDQDELIVIQPSTSTPGLNILVLKNVGILDKKVVADIKALIKKEKIETIRCTYIIRPPGAKGFILVFRNPQRFHGALTTLYLKEKDKRCRAIRPDEGDVLIIQPKPSTDELNILILENFNKVVGEYKEKIDTAIAELDIILCDSVRPSGKKW